MKVGEKIRKYRLQKGLLQKDLAIMCRMSESAIRNYELGNRTPKPKHLEIIAQALEISPFALLDPDLESSIGIMHAFFYLEEHYGLKVFRPDNDPLAYLTFDTCTPSGSEMFDRIQDWMKAKESLSEEDYERWKDIYPATLDGSRVKRYGKY